MCYPYLQRLLHRRLQLRRRRHAAIVCTVWRHTARQAQQCMTNSRAAGCRAYAPPRSFMHIHTRAMHIGRVMLESPAAAQPAEN